MQNILGELEHEEKVEISRKSEGENTINMSRTT